VPSPASCFARPASRFGYGPGFWVVAYAFAVTMAFSTVPTPLYVLYQRRDGFSTLMITVIFAAYGIGVIASLFLAGHVSDWVGRRRALVPAILVSVVSGLIFLVWPALPGLLVARVLNGFSVGVVTPTATAYLSELHSGARPGAPSRRAEVVATAANLGGLGCGALIAGLLAEVAPDPLRLPYLVFVALMVLGAVAVTLVIETGEAPVPPPAYRPQRVSVPAASRAPYFAAAVGALVSFSALGLFTSLAPTFLAKTLHHTSHALAGLTVFAVFGAGALLQSILSRQPTRSSLLTGAVALPIGLGLVVLAVWLPSPSLAAFLAGGAVTGAGMGVLFKGILSAVIAMAPAEQRAEALAGIFLAGYIGLTLPAVGMGVALRYTEPKWALLCFGTVVMAATVVSARALLREWKPGRTPGAEARPAGG
jgi:MFS family permease